MQPNPVKFQGIVIQYGNRIENIEFNISRPTIKPSAKVKLLGVHIDAKLNFEEHVNALCRKASWHINALCRISKYLDLPSRKAVYHAFVLSNFQYCNVIWHFCSKESQIKLEKIHKRALRVVLNDYTSSYTELLRMMKRPSLYVSRIKDILLDVYKTTNGTNPSFLCDLFTSSDIPYDVRDPYILVQPKVRTEKYGKHSFRYFGSKVWNELPMEMKNASDLEHFKSCIESWTGPECSCSSCILCFINRM